MSLLTDHDYLLHALHLSYLRHVLPSHAPSSAFAGHSPYNLLSFPPSTLSHPDSPYLALSPALRDEETFPELRSGRGSPPLALQLARGGGGGDEADGGAGGTAAAGGSRRRGGPGQLQYTKTIGKGGESAGAAASLGRGKGRRGKMSGAEKEMSPQREERRAEAAEGGEGASAGVFDRRHPEDAFLTGQRASQPSLAPPASAEPSSHPHLPDPTHPLPPELVIHSPVRTPAHSPPVSPQFSAGQQPFQPFQRAAAEATSSPAPADPSGEDLTGSPSSPVPGAYSDAPPQAATRRQRFADEPPSVVPSSPASPSDFPTRPPVAASPSSLSSSASSSASASPYPSPSPAATPSAGDQDDSSVSSSFVPPANAAAASMASSGVSLFGTSRLTGARLGPIGEGEDSEASDFLAAPPPQRVEPPSPPPPVQPEVKEEDQQQQPVIPAFQLPPGLRVRERRRVNLRPGIGLVIPPSLGGPLAPPAAARASPAPVEQPPPPPPPAAQQPASPSPPAPATTTNDSLAPPPRSTSRPSSPQPILFPIRAVYIRQSRPASSSPPDSSPAAPKRSNLSVLLAPAPASTSAGGEATPGRAVQENPFARLYSSLISRTAAPPPPPAPVNRRRRGPPPPPAPDAPLRLTLWFPHSTSENSVKVLLKNPRTLSGGITVEEVLGVGLFSYIEAGRQPPLDEGMSEAERLEWARRAREGEETARWSLRIVEEGEEGEVDEDFPPLDRTRNISAFAFTEFAIVKAEGEQQVADNLAKQSTLTRRPSRILLNPVPTRPPTANPTSSSSALTSTGTGDSKPNAGTSKPDLTLTLPIHIPPTLAGPSVLSIPISPSLPLSSLLDRILSALTPPPSLFPQRQPPPGSFPLNPAEYALLLRLSDSDLVLPLDKTVEGANLLSLASDSSGAGGVGGKKGGGGVGAKELWVVPKSVLGGVGLGLGPRMGALPAGAGLGGRRSMSGGGRREGEAVDGLAGVGDGFAPPSPHLTSSPQAAAAAFEQQQQQQPGLAVAGPPYLHYNVLRKLPMSLGGRHPRTIAIDGDYLHFMPPDPRFGHATHNPNLPLTSHHDPSSTSGRTTSLHISSVHSCKVSRRSAQSFKIVVHTPRNIDKRYDFEAQSAEEAREIVERVREVMRVYLGAERTGRSGQGGRLVKGGGRG